MWGRPYFRNPDESVQSDVTLFFICSSSIGETNLKRIWSFIPFRWIEILIRLCYDTFLYITGVIIPYEPLKAIYKNDPDASRYEVILGMAKVERYFEFSSDEVRFGLDEARRNSTVEQFVKVLLKDYRSQITAVVLNEYTDWTKSFQVRLAYLGTCESPALPVHKGNTIWTKNIFFSIVKIIICSFLVITQKLFTFSKCNEIGIYILIYNDIKLLCKICYNVISCFGKHSRVRDGLLAVRYTGRRPFLGSWDRQPEIKRSPSSIASRPENNNSLAIIWWVNTRKQINRIMAKLSRSKYCIANSTMFWVSGQKAQGGRFEPTARMGLSPGRHVGKGNQQLGK